MAMASRHSVFRGFGPGPVFAFEWKGTTRRWQLYAARVVFSLVILLAVWAVWSRYAGVILPESMARHVGPTLYMAYVLAQLGMITLVAPAATAGAICQEKDRGSLTLLFTTDLSNSEIVLGKLFARLAPVFGVLMCGLPIVLICGLLGGVDLEAVALATLIAACMGLLGCTLALAVSVWGRKVHGVLIGVYFLLVGWLFVLPIFELLGMGLLNPTGFARGGFPMGFPLVFALFEPSAVATSASLSPVAWSHPVWLVLAPYLAPGAVPPWDYLLFSCGTIGLSVFLVLISILRVRSVHLSQLGRPTRATRFLRLPARWTRSPGADDSGSNRGWLPGPSLDGNPVLWREWHRSAPSLARRILWDLYFILLFILFLPIFIDVLGSGQMILAPELLPISMGFALGFGLLLLSVSASTSLAEERARGSLDVLMTTPLPTSSIVWGKWWGVGRGAMAVTALPAISSILFGWKAGEPLDGLLSLGLILTAAAVIVSLGLALATWCRSLARASSLGVALYLLAAIGWPLVVLMLGIDGGTRFVGPLLDAPWYGPAVVLNAGDQVGRYRTYMTDIEVSRLRAWAVFWIIFNAALALGLLLATLRSFDHCLGRVSQNSDESAMKIL